jgi:threonine/homoserine/homoserine lactone efflux protein
LPRAASWLAFALIALGMVLTPGPNMICVVSRSLCQRRAALAGALYLVALALQAARPDGRSSFPASARCERRR